MRLLFVGILFLIPLCFNVSAQKLDEVVCERPEFEDEAVSIINEVRLDPKKYSALIAGYKKYVKRNVMYLPESLPLRLREGKAVLTDASSALNKTAGLKKFSRSKSFDLAARAQLNDLLVNDKIGHTGLDGSTFVQRLRTIAKFSGGAGENIVHGATSPLQTVTTMLIDDGLKSRPHRKSLLNKDFVQIGAACGKNPEQKPICVFVFGKAVQAYEL